MAKSQLEKHSKMHSGGEMAVEGSDSKSSTLEELVFVLNCSWLLFYKTT